MLHSRQLNSKPDEATPANDPDVPVLMDLSLADRSSPPWVTGLTALFTVVGSICLLAVPVMSMYFQSFPEMEQGRFAALLLGLVGLAAIVCALLLDYAKIRALTGYRSERDRLSRRTNFWVGGVVCGLLFLVHPLLALGPVLSVVMAVLARKISQRSSRQLEPFWDFDRDEALSLLAGRDGQGLRLATLPVQGHPFEAAILRILPWLAVLASQVIASILAASAYLSIPAIPAIALLTFWATDGLLQGGLADFSWKGLVNGKAGHGTPAQMPPTSPEDRPGLQVAGLSAQDRTGRVMLSSLTFDVAPGSMVGIVGDSGSGKSLLLKCLQDPFSLDDLNVQGNVVANGLPVWARTSERQTVASVLLPEQPILLPTSGLNNLTAFRTGPTAERGRKLLEQLVLSVETAESICSVPDARLLPSQNAKLLCLARGFLMSPDLYLMDRPEAGLNDRALGALCHRIQQEKRLGHSLLVVTEHRAMLDLCDQLIVMQEGRIIDMGPAKDLRERMTSGWARLVAERSLESEDNLMLWVRNQFKRPGDEGNRRPVGLLAADLLTLSCASMQKSDQARVTFEFKHQQGYCILRMIDEGEMLSSATLERARTTEPELNSRFPLARVLRKSRSFDCKVEEGRRIIDLTIETYDPRKLADDQKAKLHTPKPDFAKDHDLTPDASGNDEQAGQQKGADLT